MWEEKKKAYNVGGEEGPKMLSSIRSLGYFTIEMRRQMAVATVKDVVFVGGIFRGQLDSRDEKPEGTLQSSQISLWTQLQSWR